VGGQTFLTLGALLLDAAGGGATAKLLSMINNQAGF
jgi:hypothetical protein